MTRLLFDNVTSAFSRGSIWCCTTFCPNSQAFSLYFKVFYDIVSVNLISWPYYCTYSVRDHLKRPCVLPLYGS